jgi:hypothetical protein
MAVVPRVSRIRWNSRAGRSMNIDSKRADRGAPATLEPVAASLVVKIVMRPMTRMLSR